VADDLKTMDCIGIYGANNQLVAEIRDPESVKPQEREAEEALFRANAAFIVRACNAHEELVKALEKLHEYTRTIDAAYRNGLNRTDPLYSAVDSALALARGKEQP